MSASEPMPRADRGRLGARKRWGPQRIVRLDQLDADTGRLIRALLAQNETGSTVTETSADPASAEGHAHDRSAA